MPVFFKDSTKIIGRLGTKRTIELGQNGPKSGGKWGHRLPWVISYQNGKFEQNRLSNEDFYRCTYKRKESGQAHGFPINYIDYIEDRLF